LPFGALRQTSNLRRTERQLWAPPLSRVPWATPRGRLHRKRKPRRMRGLEGPCCHAVDPRSGRKNRAGASRNGSVARSRSDALVSRTEVSHERRAAIGRLPVSSFEPGTNLQLPAALGFRNAPEPKFTRSLFKPTPKSNSPLRPAGVLLPGRSVPQKAKCLIFRPRGVERGGQRAARERLRPAPCQPRTAADPSGAGAVRRGRWHGRRHVSFREGDAQVTFRDAVSLVRAPFGSRLLVLADVHHQQEQGLAR